MDGILNLNGQEASSIDKVDGDVMSTAVIQFREPDPPVPFRQLEEDTNLNSLPDNWLKTNFPGHFSDGLVRKSKPFDLSSFRMANRYLDHVGDVDVISDAENIKRLLKYRHSNTRLSMAVHRVGNTLLINELDIPKIISGASHNPVLSERLNWLWDFYCDVVGTSQDNEFRTRRDSREEEPARRILSKFLHHSIANSPSVQVLPGNQNESIYLENSNERDFIEKFQESDDYTPDSSRISCADYPKIESEPEFRREILWNLGDISMLVGSNMQIFGGGKYPVVSLRLRDATKPINVLTGMDFWLDNLMCNVPELVMCYHLEGLVQKYEVFPTEELPKLEGCKFSPGVVKDIAQDILSFLKSQCTKEGHTYWLFKDHESDFVKLYDLTSICNEKEMENSLNPFTFPVASLLYRVARNMISNGIQNRKEAIAACSLLQNCINLLEKDNHSELTLAAHYLLAQIYMTDSFPDEDVETPDRNFDEYYIHDDGSDYPDIEKGKVWLESTREEKCRATISFIVKALHLRDQIREVARPRSLTFDGTESRDPLSLANNTEQINSATNAIVPRNDKQLVLETRLCNEYGLHLDSSLETRLKCNAITAYTSLGAISIGKNKYGRAIKCLKIALSCLETISTSQRPLSLRRKHAEIGMRIGDICLKVAHTRSATHEDCSTLSEEDAQFVSLFSSSTFKEESDRFPYSRIEIDNIFKLSSEELLIKALSWYEESLDVSPDDEGDQENVQQIFEITARLGNVRNELGVFYMDMASAIIQNYGEPSSEEQDLWKKSYQYFEKGIEAFSVVSDRQNMALLYSNKARLMRLCAQSYGNSTRPSEDVTRGEFIQPERLYFNKAFEFYQKSLSILGSRAKMPAIWDQISYDLSGAYFIMACSLQDNAPLSSLSFEEVSKEFQALMMKSLHYCQEEEHQARSPRYKDVRYRIGTIHHRIGSMYQYSLRNKGASESTKKLKSLSDLHYNKAYVYLDAEENSIVEYLTSLNEHIALNSQLELRNTSPYTIVKRLRCALVLLLREKNIAVLRAGAKALEKIRGTKGGSVAEKSYHEYGNESTSCRQIDQIGSMNCSIGHIVEVLSVLEVMVSNVLKDLVLTFSKSPKIKIVDQLDHAESKRMYEIFLRRSTCKAKDCDKLEEGICLFLMLADIIEKIRAESKLDDLKSGIS